MILNICSNVLLVFNIFLICTECQAVKETDIIQGEMRIESALHQLHKQDLGNNDTYVSKNTRSKNVTSKFNLRSETFRKNNDSRNSVEYSKDNKDIENMIISEGAGDKRRSILKSLSKVRTNSTPIHRPILKKLISALAEKTTKLFGLTESTTKPRSAALETVELKGEGITKRLKEKKIMVKQPLGETSVMGAKETTGLVEKMQGTKHPLRMREWADFVAQERARSAEPVGRMGRMERMGQRGRMPSADILDMAAAKGNRAASMRFKGRLCHRHVLLPEGPKYDSAGRPYLAAHGRGAPFERTRRPRLLLPACCNCCKKSVLGCE